MSCKGRKPIFPNVWVSFILRIPAGLNSSDNSFTPMKMAYISDVLPEHQRTLVYSVAYAFCAIGLFVGVGLAILLGIVFGNEANFIAIAVLDIVQIGYVYISIPESLKREHRKPFTTSNLNPLTPLSRCCFGHPIGFYVSIVQFFLSLPETGILDMAVIYTLDQLAIHNELGQQYTGT